MIYKIFPSLLLLVVSFLQAICSSQRLKQKTKQKTKQKLPKQKNTSESNAEVVYNNLNSNQFALPKESFTKALKGFIY
jgi:hypothetical protein